VILFMPPGKPPAYAPAARQIWLWRVKFRPKHMKVKKPARAHARIKAEVVACGAPGHSSECHECHECQDSHTRLLPSKISKSQPR
jgi:hypothetical protein